MNIFALSSISIFISPTNQQFITRFTYKSSKLSIIFRTNDSRRKLKEKSNSIPQCNTLHRIISTRMNNECHARMYIEIYRTRISPLRFYILPDVSHSCIVAKMHSPRLYKYKARQNIYAIRDWNSHFSFVNFLKRSAIL